jgi:membrane protein
MTRPAIDEAPSLMTRWNVSRPGRALFRYFDARGSVLGAGIAFYAVFSIFPALAVGFTAFAYFLGGRKDLQADLVDYINRVFGMPVIALEPGDEGLVTVDQLIQTTAVGLAGLVGGLALLWSGLGWLSATRQGIRAVFGLPPSPNYVTGKLRDLLVLVTVGLMFLTSVSASVVLNTATDTVLDLLGLPSGAWTSSLLWLISTLMLLVVDTALLLLFFRILTAVRLPMKDLLPGALAGAVALGALTLGGSLLLRVVSGNQFLAAFGVIIGLLVWMSLAARIILVAAAWSATTAAEHGRLPRVGFEVLALAPLPASAAPLEPSSPQVPAGPGWARPDYGQRAADGVSVAAGAVLGAGALAGVRVLRNAGRAVRDTLR